MVEFDQYFAVLVIDPGYRSAGEEVDAVADTDDRPTPDLHRLQLLFLLSWKFLVLG